MSSSDPENKKIKLKHSHDILQKLVGKYTFNNSTQQYTCISKLDSWWNGWEYGRQNLLKYAHTRNLIVVRLVLCWLVINKLNKQKLVIDMGMVLV